MTVDTVERGPVVLLALPFRFRCEINLAREAMSGPGRDALDLLITSPWMNGFSASTTVPTRTRYRVGIGPYGFEQHATAILCATFGA